MQIGLERQKRTFTLTQSATTMRRYKLTKVGLTGLFFQEVAINVMPLMPSWLSANVVTIIGLSFACSVPMLMPTHPGAAAAAIIFATMLDFMDGVIARARNASSEFGRVLDATSDLVLWLGTLFGIYLRAPSTVLVVLLLVYTGSLFWRHQLGHSTSFIDPPSAIYQQANDMSVLVRLKPFFYPVINYYDSLAGLSIILIFDADLISYWLLYELARRVLILLKQIREIHYIYILGKGSGRDRLG